MLEDGTTNIAIGARSLTAATSATENIAIGFQSAQAFSYEEVGNISIGANAIALNSGTIKDAGTSDNSTITNAASIGTAAGTITVTA